MAYRASNGILTAEISDEEAHAHYTGADLVWGHFGGRFVTAIRTEDGWGREVAAAETYYEPLDGTSIDDLEDLAGTVGARRL